MTSGEVLIFVAFGAVAGLLVGLLIGTFFGGRGKEDRKTPPAVPAAPADAWTELRKQYQERASLWLERSTGRLVVRLNGRMLDHPQQLSPEEMQQHQGLFKEWLRWINMADPQNAAQNANIARPHGADVIITPPPATEKPAAPTAAARPAVLPAAPVAPVAPVAPAAANAAAPAAKSIVSQINDVLQELLAVSSVAQKAVRLAEDPRKGVVVWVGLEPYNGVEAVPDPEVKALLKAAAAEWERRSRRA